MEVHSYSSRAPALSNSAYARRRLYNQLALETPFSRQSDTASTKLGRTTSPVLQHHEEEARRRLRSRNGRSPVNEIPLGRHSAARAASRLSRRGPVDTEYEGELQPPFCCPPSRQAIPCWVPMDTDDFALPQGEGARLVSKDASLRRRSTSIRDQSPVVADAIRSRFETPRWGGASTGDSPPNAAGKEAAMPPEEPVRSTKRASVSLLKWAEL